MSEQIIPTCGKRRVPREWRATDFEYREDGITVRVSNIYAWVCPVDGEVAFTPATADELSRTVRSMLVTAKEARTRQSMLTEYSVSFLSGEQLRPAA